MRIIKQGLISRITDSFFNFQSWPSACTDENGVIYVVCSGCRMGHVDPFGKTVLYKSRDCGETYSLPVIVNDHYLDDRDAGILYLGGGEFIVTRCSHRAASYETEYRDWISTDSGEAGLGLLKHYKNIPADERRGGCFYRILTDYAEKAQEEKRIPVHCPHGPTLLQSGRIFYLGKEVFSEDPSRKDSFSVYISDDRGCTFIKHAECPIPDGYTSDQFHEVHCAELPSGRILALFRTHLTDDDLYFTIMKTYSDDGGKTWSEWEKTGICGSPPHLCRLPDGRCILTYGRRVSPYGIYGREVSPDGEISDNEFQLAACSEIDSDLGYPATVVLPDGTLYTAYYARFETDSYASLFYVKWEI